MDGVFADATGGVGREQWDEIAGDRLYSTRGWLDFCAGLPGQRAGAVVADAGRGPTAVPVSAVVDQRSGFYRWDGVLRELGVPAKDSTGVLVGPARGYQTHVLSSGPPPDEGVRRLLAQLRRVPAHAARTGLLGPDPPARPPAMAMYLSTGDVAALREAGAEQTPVLLGADAWFHLPDGGWDGWLASLSAKRRSTVRRDLRRFEQAGCHLQTVPFGSVVELISGLQVRTDRRYGRKAPPEAVASSFRRMSEAMNGEGRAVLCYQGDRVVGYCAYFLRGETLYLRSAGFDYEELAGAAEYFATVYYGPIRAAAAAGARWVHAGVEAEDAKALRGAELRPLWMLELTPDGPLAGLDERVRRRNADVSAGIAAISPAVERAWRHEAERSAEFGLARHPGRRDP